MTVSFVDIFENNKEISSEEINYVIPYSGKLLIKDVNPDSCILNHKLIAHGTDFELPVRQDDITLSCGGDTIRIKILKGELSRESIIDYQDIYEQYLSYTNDNCFNYHDLLKAFDINNTEAIRLCSFNKKFTHLLQSSNRNEILRNVKYLPHIFYRPKLHLKQVEEVRPASIVTRIGSESIRHLASHSEHWKGIKANGLIPERLLARILEDDYAIYENIAAKTIVDRLYALIRKEKEDAIDCKMNFTLSESYSQGGERQNFFDAINFLFKGFENSEFSTTQKLVEETLEIINSILEYLSKCKSTNLYRHIKKEKEITGSLKKTNIFMMDNYYKKVYQLWELLGKKEEIAEILEKKELKEEYLLYVELVILFCLNYMGFKPEKDEEILLRNNLFNHCSFTFKDWKITLNTEKVKLFDGFITAEITQKRQIPVSFKIKLPPADNPAYQQYKAKRSDDQIIFEQKLTDNEQKKLCSVLQESIPKKEQREWSLKFKNTLSNAMMNVNYAKKSLLFIPWKYGIADDFKIAKETLRQIGELLPSNFDECYVLNTTRPNELKNINDESLLNSLVSYNLRNQESVENKEFSIIPITLNDINSFRRFSKIFLKNMITIKNEQTCCPQCGLQFKGDKTQGYFCVNPDCNFKIYNSQCPSCKKKYWYTDYTFPKVFQLDTESIGMKILLNENELGFKNITSLSYDHKPECPYCNSKEISKGRYCFEDYLIKPETDKKIMNVSKKSDIIIKEEAQKKIIISGKVEFIEPSRKNTSMQVISSKQIKVLSHGSQILSKIKCPYCNNYNKEKEKSLILHIYNRHLGKAKADGYIKALGPMIKCVNCKESIEDCSDTMTMKHLNKECNVKGKVP